MNPRRLQALRALAFAVVCAPLGADAIPLINGLGGPAGYGTGILDPNDDGSTGSIDIRPAFGTRGANFFGTFQAAMFVNNNGNITFAGPVGSFTPTPFPISSQPMIAPWWGDVDTRGVVASPVGSNATYYDVRPGRATITWFNVGYFSLQTNLLNNFQLILTDRSAERVAGDFDVEFRYDRCEWTTGSASGGVGGLGGTPAQAGFDAGNGRDFVILDGSRTAAVLLLCTTTNVTGGAPGLWRFQIRSGGVAECGNGVRESGEECDDTNTTPGDGCSASCRTELAPGAACSASDQCRSGFCTDGVCCGSRCDGQCEVCNATPGTCTAVTGAPLGGRGACMGTGTCGGACDGTLRTACTYPTATTQCAAGTCASGSATSAGTCNGAGACSAGTVSACAPYVCGATACRTDCATDADCATGNYCNGSMRCVPLQAPGATCDRVGACASGNCVDGVCCNTACDGQCEACNVTGSVGTCAASTGAPVGSRAACAGAGTTCGGTCNGTLRTACTYPGDATSCRAASCADGSATLPAACDGAGACPAASTSPCAPYACGESGCLTACTSSAQCSMGNACIDGMCVGRRPNGGMCATTDECTSGQCVDGVCCDTACDGQCEACNAAGLLGTCSPATGAPVGSRAACAGTGACAGACDGTNRAACTFPGAATECAAAGCAAGVATSSASCDGAGACGATTASPCMNYTCGTTTCRTTCEFNTDCANGFVCASGACVLPTPDAGVIVADAGVVVDVPVVSDLGVTTDAGMKGVDVQVADAGAGMDGSIVGTIRGDGCACSTVGATHGASGRGALAAGLLAGLALVTTRRRRRG